LIYSCKPTQKGIRKTISTNKTVVINSEKSTRFSTGADNYKSYFSLLENKRVGVITNQTGVVLYDSIFMYPDTGSISHAEGFVTKRIYLVDFLLKNKINIQKIYAPEHGFRLFHFTAKTENQNRNNWKELMSWFLIYRMWALDFTLTFLRYII
jgi:uncharacterized protein YbbC (DUF1343 family)